MRRVLHQMNTLAIWWWNISCVFRETSTRPRSRASAELQSQVGRQGLVYVRFGAHSGLKSDIALSPKSANFRHPLNARSKQIPPTREALELMRTQAQGSGDLDHERDIILAIHAAIPDLIRDTNRHVIQAGSGCLMALARRFGWNSRVKPVSRERYKPNHRREAPLQIERPIR